MATACNGAWTQLAGTATTCNSITQSFDQWQTAGNTIYAQISTAGTAMWQTNIDPILNQWQWTQWQWQFYNMQGTVFTYGGQFVETDEQRLERERAAKEHEAAAKRAEQFLVQLLDDEQRDSWEKEKRFDVIVKGKVYRLRPLTRVHLIEKGKLRAAFCIHPEFHHGLPAEDILVAQKLLLESDEAEFLRIANRTNVA